MKRVIHVLLALLVVPSLVACATADLPPIQPVAHVNLPEFMGCWYVIASISPSFAKDTYDSRECYRLKRGGDEVATRFHYRAGAFDGPRKIVHSTGFVDTHKGNAVWGVQFIWPFRAQYIVAYLGPRYQSTIIARDARDYAWIMARTPTVPASEYQQLVGRLRALGYSLKHLRKEPQRWPDPPMVARSP